MKNADNYYPLENSTPLLLYCAQKNNHVFIYPTLNADIHIDEHGAISFGTTMDGYLTSPLIPQELGELKAIKPLNNNPVIVLPLQNITI